MCPWALQVRVEGRRALSRGAHCSQTNLHSHPVVCSPFLGAPAQTLTFHPIPNVSWGMEFAEEHPFVYKHLSRAGPDRPKNLISDIVGIPECCQGMIWVLWVFTASAWYAQVLWED